MTKGDAYAEAAMAALEYCRVFADADHEREVAWVGTSAIVYALLAIVAELKVARE